MEKLFMSAGIVVGIILCVISILKLPFKKFKEKHPIGYKALFTSLTFVFAIGLSVLDELFILYGQIISTDFAILSLTVIAGVFSGYNGIYEGLGLKQLVKKLFEKIKKVKELSSDKKIVKFLNKIEDLDKVISLIEERKHNENKEV